MPVTWIQVRDILDEALQIPAEDRSRYLDHACPQPELRRYVNSLIVSYEKATEFLEQPAVTLLAEPWQEAESPQPWVGRRIGFYLIEKEIGEGGMGTVFQAVRADDEYQKRVAIKLVKGGFASSFAIARFKAERQILAGLEHPNVARLLDGGRTEEGYPYLVMEFVDGVPIDEYCDAHRLTISQRLTLFRTVCDAVRFAHQNLIVHRDLKPANILVTSDAVPKLLDFGIAKLLSPAPLSPTVEQTLGFVRMLTPDYASPEQVCGQPINTTTDVYSLGVVLYMLISGHHPYQLTGRSPQSLEDIICHTEPVKPSEIVVRTETISLPGEDNTLTITPDSVSAARDTKPDKLRRRLSGDLDNIVLMALRKDPRRRYSSVEQFSDDIRRHLEGLPVRAREDTLVYRSSRFVKRHKLAVAAVIIFVITLLGGIVMTMREARIARAERARAERRFNDVRALADSLIFEVHDSIQNLPGATPVRKLIVDRALQYLDSLATESRGDVALQRDLAAAYQRVGLVQGNLFAGNLGDYGSAVKSTRKASDIWDAVARSKGATIDDQINTASAHRVLGNTLEGAGEGGAKDQALQALAISEHLHQIAPTNAGVLRELSRDYEALADHESWSGDFAASLSYLRKEYQLQKEILQATPNDHELQRRFAIVSVKVGQKQAMLGSRQEGLANIRQGIEIYRALPKNESDTVRRRELAAFLSQQGFILSMDGQPAAALQSYQQQLSIVQGLAAEDPQNALLRADVADGLESVGWSLVMVGRPREGFSMLERSEKAFEEESKVDLSGRAGLASNRITFGEGLLVNGRVREALGKFREALADYEQIATLPGAVASSRTNLAIAHLDIASALSLAGDSTSASVEFRRTIEIAQPLALPSNEQARYTLANAYSGLADLTARSGTRQDLMRARELYKQSLEVWKTIPNPGALTPDGYLAGDPRKTTRALDSCNARLAMLNRS